LDWHSPGVRSYGISPAICVVARMNSFQSHMPPPQSNLVQSALVCRRVKLPKQRTHACANSMDGSLPTLRLSKGEK